MSANAARLNGAESGINGLRTEKRPHGRHRQEIQGWISAALKAKSGRRGSNPRQVAWEATTLPLSYSRGSSLLPSLAPVCPAASCAPGGTCGAHPANAAASPQPARKSLGRERRDSRCAIRAIGPARPVRFRQKSKRNHRLTSRSVEPTPPAGRQHHQSAPAIREMLREMLPGGALPRRPFTAILFVPVCRVASVRAA